MVIWLGESSEANASQPASPASRSPASRAWIANEFAGLAITKLDKIQTRLERVAHNMIQGRLVEETLREHTKWLSRSKPAALNGVGTMLERVPSQPDGLAQSPKYFSVVISTFQKTHSLICLLLRRV